MLDIAIQIFTSYIITVVITGSTLFEPVRLRVIELTPSLYSPLSFIYKDVEYSKHPIECRLCTGFWISILVCLFYLDLQNLGIVYGASYFLATQER